MTISLDEQIACIKRELTMRGKWFPQRVARGKMKQAEATREIKAMRAVLQTLLQLQDGQKVREGGTT